MGFLNVDKLFFVWLSSQNAELCFPVHFGMSIVYFNVSVMPGFECAAISFDLYLLPRRSLHALPAWILRRGTRTRSSPIERWRCATPHGSSSSASRPSTASTNWSTARANNYRPWSNYRYGGGYCGGLLLVVGHSSCPSYLVRLD